MKQFISYAGVAVVITLVFGTIYGTVQQTQRNDANYPQIQMAEDTAGALDQGAAAKTVVGGEVDMAKSLAPFRIIYDTAGHVVVGSGYLDGRVPMVPLGVLTAAKGKPYHAVTWQPKAGVRVAAVVVATDKYYVLGGRSLTEVEQNEHKTFQLAVLGGVASLAVLGAMYIFKSRLIRL